MTVYCSECGSVIEDGEDFCVRCGALRRYAFDMDDNGNLTAVDSNAPRMCPNCGFTNRFSDNVCADCGAPLPHLTARRSARKLMTEDYIKLAIGLIAGAAGICGIGHLLYRRYSKGLMYLVLSSVILYVELSVGFSSSYRFMMLRIIGLYIFFSSSFDLLRLAYYTEPPSDRKGGD